MSSLEDRLIHEVIHTVPEGFSDGQHVTSVPCFSPTCLLFQVINSLGVHMPGGEGQVGGRGEREGLSFPGYRRDTFIAMTGAWGEKQHIHCWVLVLFWTPILKACIVYLTIVWLYFLWCWDLLCYDAQQPQISFFNFFYCNQYSASDFLAYVKNVLITLTRFSY